MKYIVKYKEHRESIVTRYTVDEIKSMLQEIEDDYTGTSLDVRPARFYESETDNENTNMLYSANITYRVEEGQRNPFSNCYIVLLLNHSVFNGKPIEELVLQKSQTFDFKYDVCYLIKPRHTYAKYDQVIIIIY